MAFKIHGVREKGMRFRNSHSRREREGMNFMGKPG